MKCELTHEEICGDDEPGKCHSVKCHCPRCTEGEDSRFFYTVKPYDWSMSGRQGTSYTIVQQRTIATAKCRGDADLIANALNGSRKMMRDIRELNREKCDLQSRNTVLCDQLHRESNKRPGASVTLDQIREAFVAEASVHCRWSSARKNVVEFYTAVMDRLKNL